MRESLVPEYLLAIALLLPLLGAAIGRITSARGNRHRAAPGFALGLFGPFAVVLYLLFTWLSEAIGLSSLLNILACLAAAVLLGAIWGKIIRASLSGHWRE